MSKAKHKIAILKALDESRDVRIGGCRLLDCEWEEESDGTSVSASVTVEWTKESEHRSQNEARGDFTEKIADVLEKQFLSPSFSRIEVAPAAETNLADRFFGKARAGQTSLSRYGYFTPNNLGSFLREYVPSLATNQYDREGHILAETDGETRAAPVTRKSLAVRALEGSFWKSVLWDDEKSAELFSSLSGTNDLKSVRIAFEAISRSLSKPTADETEFASRVLGYLDVQDLLGPFDWVDRDGFLHHLGCGIVPLDDRNFYTRKKSGKQAAKLADEFARFPLLASVQADDNGKENKELLVNSECRTIPVFNTETTDAVSEKSLAVVVVEVVY